MSKLLVPCSLRQGLQNIFEQPKVFQGILRSRKYIVFPPEGPRPDIDIKPSKPEEFEK